MPWPVRQWFSTFWEHPPDVLAGQCEEWGGFIYCRWKEGLGTVCSLCNASLRQALRFSFFHPAPIRRAALVSVQKERGDVIKNKNKIKLVCLSFCTLIQMRRRAWERWGGRGWRTPQVSDLSLRTFALRDFILRACHCSRR